MKITILFFLLLWNFTLCNAAQEALKVAIFDTPVDLEGHQALCPFFDQEMLKGIKINFPGAGEISIYDLNKEGLLNLYRQSRVRFPVYTSSGREDIDYPGLIIDHTFPSCEVSGDTPFENVEYHRLFWHLAGNDHANDTVKDHIDFLYELMGNMFHGTHVSALACHRRGDMGSGNLHQNVKIIPLPFDPEFLTMKFDSAKPKLTKANLEEQIAQYEANIIPAVDQQLIDEMSRILQENQVRIVNMSVGISLEEAMSELRNKVDGGCSDDLFRRWVTLKVKSSLQMVKQAFYRNPGTIFVLAAGNDGADVDELRMDWSKAKGPNVVMVGATNGKEDSDELALTDFSNFDRIDGVADQQDVDIAANGLWVLSAKAHSQEKYTHMPGTSMAAPIVTSKLIEILLEHSYLSSEQAISCLYDQKCLRSTDLERKIQEGRYLPGGKSREDV